MRLVNGSGVLRRGSTAMDRDDQVCRRTRSKAEKVIVVFIFSSGCPDNVLFQFVFLLAIAVTRVTLVPVASLFLMAAATSGANELLDELAVCRQLPSDEARLICYDDAMDSHNQRGALRSTSSSAPQPTTEISQEELFGKSDEEAQRAVEMASGTARIDRLEARVTRLQWSRSKFFVVTLDNGQVWRQIDTGNLRLSEGDDVIIRKAAFGSFMMQKPGSKRSVRVKRSN
jgi:polyhydroxyalkanoate synthesis regulator phasin